MAYHPYADDSGPARYFRARARENPRAQDFPTARTGARGPVCRRETPRPAKRRYASSPILGPSCETCSLSGVRSGRATGRDPYACLYTLATIHASCVAPGLRFPFPRPPNTRAVIHAGHDARELWLPGPPPQIRGQRYTRAMMHASYNCPALPPKHARSDTREPGCSRAMIARPSPSKYARNDTRVL